ncbi:MAG: tetratricopeptide repeat protein [Myxococcaceae bacterium]|nr:tetratricopeptide repeat protein [Myxococcaceae bacterium]
MAAFPLVHPPPRAPYRPGARLRAAAWASLAALVVHLIPFFFPRKVPAVEIDLARMMTDAEHRTPLLVPLLDNPQSTPANLREAAELVLPASVATARRFLAEAERRGAPSVENELLRARICAADRDPTCVESALAKARALGPKDPRPELLESELAERAGDPAEALASLIRAHHKAQSDVPLTLRLAHALARASRVEEGVALIDTVRDALGPVDAAVERGVLWLEANRPADARAELERALALDRHDARVHYFHAVALARLGDGAKAEVELREADRLDPGDYRALAMLCALQREDGRVDEAAVSRAILEKRFGDRRFEFDETCPP